MEKYLYSQFRPCLARWFAFTGCRDARSEEQPLLEHSPAVLHKGTVWFLPFPCSVSNSEAGTEEKSVQGCKTLQEPLENLSPPWSCLGWESCVMMWSWTSGPCPSLCQGQGQIPERTPIHAPAAEQWGDLYRAPYNSARLRTLPLRLPGACRLLGFVKAWRSTSDLFDLTHIFVW